MDYQTYTAIIFFAILSLVLILKRKKIDFQFVLGPLLYFAMYKTKLGLVAMDKLASKLRGFLKYLAYLGVVVGFLGMGLICFELFRNIVKLIMTPEAISGVGVVQPFAPNVPGTVFVPFFYFIVSIFIIAVVHEFSHGVIARVHNIKLKSSGFAFLGVVIPIIPAAFVEPDEKVVEKRPAHQQLSVYAAGPFSNILLAFTILGLFILAGAPLVESVVDFDGIRIISFAEGDFPAQKAGMEVGEVIHDIDGVMLSDLSNFSALLAQHSPGDTIKVTTDQDVYDVTLAPNPANSSLAYFGVSAKPEIIVKESFEQKYGKVLPQVLLWLIGLAYWLFLLNLGIGLFNLVPLGPIDGGRMFKTALERFLPKKLAVRIWSSVSFMVLLAIVLNLALSLFR